MKICPRGPPIRVRLLTEDCGSIPVGGFLTGNSSVGRAFDCSGYQSLLSLSESVFYTFI